MATTDNVTNIAATTVGVMTSLFNDTFDDIFGNVTSNFTDDINGIDDIFGNVTSNFTDDINGTGRGVYIPQEESYYLRLSFGLWKYGGAILIILGTFGNILSAIVMLRKELCQGSTTSLYLAVLAFVDLAVLYTGLLRQWIFMCFKIDVRSLSEFSCRVHPFITYVLMQYQAWIIVNVTIERLVAVFVPHKTSIIFTRSRAIICLVVTAGIICCINLHFFFTMEHDIYNYEYQDVDGDGIMDPTPPSFEYCAQDRFITKVWPWLDLAIFSLVPSAILIGCNVAIIIKMASVRHMHDRSAAAQARITGMTIILLTVSLVFLITTLPISIYLLMNEFMPKNPSRDKFLEMQLAWAFVNLLVYVNNVANFFLYCISGTRFRREVVALLFACVGKKRREKSKGGSYALSESKTTITQAGSVTS